MAEVTDGDDGKPIASAQVLVTYWNDKNGTAEKEEIEIRTKADGTALLPNIPAAKAVITVTAKGYRSCLRWLKSNLGGANLRVQLEKWQRPK